VPTFREVLDQWARFELGDSLYVQPGETLGLESAVEIVPCDRATARSLDGKAYLLGIEQVRDVIDGLAAQLERSPTMSERLKAVLHYAEHDAFIDPEDL
jgi:hypothetical protein